MTKKMKIILGVVVAAGLVAGAISYKNASNASSPETEEVEEAEKLNPVGPVLCGAMRLRSSHHEQRGAR